MQSTTIREGAGRGKEGEGRSEGEYRRENERERKKGEGGSRRGSVLPQHLRCGLQSTTIREGDGRGKEGKGKRGWGGGE